MLNSSANGEIQKATTNTEQTQHAVADAADRIAAAINATSQPGDYKGACERGQRARDYDLCAQWKAADAAGEAALYTKRAFAAAAIAAFLTFLALIFTAIGTRSATRQVRLMRDSQMPDIALRTAQFYVLDGPGSAHDVTGTPPKRATFGLTFHNRGNGIAYPQRAFYGWEVSTGLTADPIYPHEFEYQVGAVAPPLGDCAGVRGTIELSDTEIQAIGHGCERLWLWIKAHFKDGEGGEHEIAHALVWAGDREFLPSQGGFGGRHQWAETKGSERYTYKRYKPPKRV